MQRTHRIFIADRSVPFRATLARYLTVLSDDYEVVGEASSDEAALLGIERIQPQIVLLDLDLPDRSGVATAQEICRRWSSIAVIALTDHFDQEYYTAARVAGAYDCLDKLAIVEQLPAVLAALGGAPQGVVAGADGCVSACEPLWREGRPRRLADAER